MQKFKSPSLLLYGLTRSNFASCSFISLVLQQTHMIVVIISQKTFTTAHSPSPSTFTLTDKSALVVARNSHDVVRPPSRRSTYIAFSGPSSSHTPFISNTIIQSLMLTEILDKIQFLFLSIKLVITFYLYLIYAKLFQSPYTNTSKS